MPETSEAGVTTTSVTNVTPAETPAQQQGAPDSWETGAGAGSKEAVLADLARTRAELKAARAAQAELDRIKAEREAENQTAAERAQAAEQRATAAEARLLRFEVAAEKSVPAHLIGYLSGDTKDAIEASAAKVLKDFSAARAVQGEAGGETPPARPNGTPAPDPSQGAKPRNPKGDVAARADALLGHLGVKTAGQQVGAQ